MDPDAGAGHDVELVAGPQREPRRRLGLFALNLAVLAAALVGVFVLGARDDDAALPPDTTVPPSSTIAPTVEQLLANMPASPIDGRQSQRLPVAATPRSGLVDGQIVTALGKGFHPGERVGAVVCLAEAALEGVAACDLGTNGGFDHVTYAEASNEGFVHVDVAVPAMIVTPFSGPVDCRSGPERCLVALGAVSDYDRSGGAAIGFAEQPPFPEPIFTVSAPGPYLPDHVADVVVTGMMWATGDRGPAVPGRPLHRGGPWPCGADRDVRRADRAAVVVHDHRRHRRHVRRRLRAARWLPRAPRDERRPDPA
jgi:hypothetical protein